jgi:hypothetical protein
VAGCRPCLVRGVAELALNGLSTWLRKETEDTYSNAYVTGVAELVEFDKMLPDKIVFLWPVDSKDY